MTAGRPAEARYSPAEDVEAEVGRLRQLAKDGRRDEQLERLRQLIERALLVERLERETEPAPEDHGPAIAVTIARILADAGPHVAAGDGGVVRVFLPDLENLARVAAHGERMFEHASRYALQARERDTWRDRARRLLATVGGRRKRCDACHAELQMVRTPVGREAPFSVDKVLNHFIDCPAADRFRARPTGRADE